jgi:GNAT superfamily N-acetyltransferase
MSIVVNPDAQGSGIGQILFHAFMEEASCRGLSMINLTTDRCDNDRVENLVSPSSERLRCLGVER